MSWLDELQPASFGGVPFGVFTVQWEAGDSTVVREYPFEDVPQVLRMSAATERLRFSAYVAGTDYKARRDALRAVLTGERVLVHPSAGAMRATALGPFKMSEAPISEGCVVKFELEFVLAGATAYPKEKVDTQGVAMSAAAAAKAAAVDQFGAEFSLASAPAWVQERVVDRLAGVLGGTWEQIKGATRGLGEFTDAITGSYQVLRDGLAEAVGAPASLAGSVRELFDMPTDLSGASASAFRGAYQSLFGYSSRVREADFKVSVPASEGQLAMAGLGQAEALGVDTAARQAQARLDAAVDRLWDTMAAAAWVQAVAAMDLPGYDEVLAWRQALYAHCTGLLTTASSGQAPTALPATNWHQVVLDLMTAGLADMQARGRSQARMSTYTPTMTMNIWSLSYELYGTVQWADELQSMNPHIRNPLIVPAGKPCKVVLHG